MSSITLTRLRGYEFRAFPTGKQAVFFHRCHGCSRKLYNLYVEEGQARDVAAAEWHAEAPEERAEEAYLYTWHKNTFYTALYPYMKEVDSLALANARINYFDARSRYFDGTAGAPNFKSKNDYPHSYTTNNQNYKNGGKGTLYVYEDEQHPSTHWLHLPKTRKMGDLHIEMHRPIDGLIHSATVKYHANGTWTVSLLVEESVDIEVDEDSAVSKETVGSFFAGDLGLKCFLTGTDGISYDDPGEYDKLERRLKLEKRKLGKKCARLKKQGKDLRKCKNYQKQRRKVARLEARIANKRRDFRHKLSRTLVNNHDVLVFENLNVKGLLKNHHLARSISQSAWSDFLRMVKYKAEGEYKTFVKIDRFFASTQTCSCCGVKTGPKGFENLDIRQWVCGECGAVNDRDENAAWNVLFEGINVLSDCEDKNVSTYWKEVLKCLQNYHKSCVNGENTLPTAGTAEVARVEVDGDVNDSDMYTERLDQACLIVGGLGESEVSGKGCQPTAVSLAVG